MLKIIFTAIVVINGLGNVQTDDAEDLFQAIDSIINPLVPLGNPETPVPEDADKLKKLCSLVNKDWINKWSGRISSFLKGVMAKLMESSLNSFTSDNIIICQLIKEGKGEKAVLITKEYNRNAVEANKVRLSFIAALHELKQKGTKASLPTLTCYAKQFTDKMIAVYPDKDGTKDFVKSWIGHTFKEIFIKTLENESGKAADICPMPDVTTNPSKINSALVAFFDTVQALQNK